MNSSFKDTEQLYRAVLPQNEVSFLWKHNGTISNAALRDKNGLSVERGYYRTDEEVVEHMSKDFHGTVFALTVKDCRDENAIVLYKPTERSIYHSEIHGSKDTPLLSGTQRKHLINKIRIVQEIKQ